MTTLYAKCALLPDGWAEDVRVVIDADGRIASVAAGVPRDAGDFDLDGRILLAAPCNLHSHAFQRAMAGRTEHRSRGRDSFWTWRDLMYRFVANVTPEQVESIAALVYMEMLEAGYAAVGEFHYIHHPPGGGTYERLSELSERVFAAAKLTGIGLTHLPVLYTHGGSGGQDLKAGQIRFGNDTERFVRLAQDAGEAMSEYLDADARAGVAPHSLRATLPEQLRTLSEVFAESPVHIHIAEQTAEVEEVEHWLGARPVDWLLDNLEINEHWCLVHATHMTQDETRRLAHSGAVAGLCPITEANLGDGVFNGAVFLAADGSFGIGSDSNVRISLSEELRMLEYSQRLREWARNVLVAGEGSSGGSLYRHALRGGARALGRRSGGIEAGLFADLVAVDGDHFVFDGLRGDPILDAWIFAADDRVVTDVWSAGRHCVQAGRHVERDRIVGRYRHATRALLGSL